MGNNEIRIKAIVEPELKDLSKEDINKYQTQLEEIDKRTPFADLMDDGMYGFVPNVAKKYIDSMRSSIIDQYKSITTALQHAIDGEKLSSDIVNGLEKGLGYLSASMTSLFSVNGSLGSIMTKLPKQMANGFEREFADMAKSASSILNSSAVRTKMGPVSDEAYERVLKNDKRFIAGTTAIANKYSLTDSDVSQLIAGIVKIVTPAHMRESYVSNVIRDSFGQVRRPKIQPEYSTFQERLPERYQSLPTVPQNITIKDAKKDKQYRGYLTPQEYAIVQQVAKNNPAFEEALINTGHAFRGVKEGSNNSYDKAGSLILPARMSRIAYGTALASLYRDVLLPSLEGAPAYRHVTTTSDGHAQKLMANKTSRTPTEGFSAFYALQDIPVMPLFTDAPKSNKYRHRLDNSIGLSSDISIRPDTYQIMSLTLDDFRAGRKLDPKEMAQSAYDEHAKGISTNKMILQSAYSDLLGMHGHNTFGNGSKEPPDAPTIIQLDLSDKIFQKKADGSNDIEFTKDGQPVANAETMKLVTDIFTRNKTFTTKSGKKFSYPTYNYGDKPYVPTTIHKNGIIDFAEESAYLEKASAFVDRWGVDVFENLVSPDEEFSTVKALNKPMEARNRFHTPSVPFSKLGGRMPSKDKTAFVDLEDVMGLNGASVFMPGFLPAEALTLRSVGFKGSGFSTDFKKLVRNIYGDVEELYAPTWAASNEIKKIYKEKGLDEVRKLYQDPSSIKKYGLHDFNEDFVDVLKYDALIDKSLNKTSFYDGKTHSQTQNLFYDILDMIGGMRGVQTDVGFRSKSQSISRQISQSIPLTDDEIKENEKEWDNYIYTLRNDPQKTIKMLFSNPDDPLSQMVTKNNDLLWSNADARGRVRDAIARAEDDKRNQRLFGGNDVMNLMALPNPFEIFGALAKLNGLKVRNTKLASAFTLGYTNGDENTPAKVAIAPWINDVEMSGYRYPNNVGEQFELENSPEYIQLLREYGMSTNAAWMNMRTIERMGGGDVDGDTIQAARKKFVAMMRRAYQERAIGVDENRGIYPQPEEIELEGGPRKAQPSDFAEALYRKAAGVFRMSKDSAAGDALSQGDWSDPEWKSFGERAGADIKAMYDIDTVFPKTGILSGMSNYALRALKMGTPFVKAYQGILGAVKEGDYDRIKDFSEVNFPSIYHGMTVNSLMSLAESPFSDDALDNIIKRQELLQGIANIDESNPIEVARRAFLRKNNSIMGQQATGRGLIMDNASEDELDALLASWGGVVAAQYDQLDYMPESETKEARKEYLDNQRYQINKQKARLAHNKEFGISQRNVEQGFGYASILKDNARYTDTPSEFQMAFDASQDALTAEMARSIGENQEFLQAQKQVIKNEQRAKMIADAERHSYNWSENHTIEKSEEGPLNWYNWYVKQDRGPKTRDTVLGLAADEVFQKWGNDRIKNDAAGGTNWGNADELVKMFDDYLLNYKEESGVKQYPELPKKGSKIFSERDIARYEHAREFIKNLPNLMHDEIFEAIQYEVNPNMGSNIETGERLASRGFIDFITKNRASGLRTVWDLKPHRYYDINRHAGTSGLDQPTLYADALPPELKADKVGLLGYLDDLMLNTYQKDITPERTQSVLARMAAISKRIQEFARTGQDEGLLAKGFFDNVLLAQSRPENPIDTFISLLPNAEMQQKARDFILAQNNTSKSGNASSIQAINETRLPEDEQRQLARIFSAQEYSSKVKEKYTSMRDSLASKEYRYQIEAERPYSQWDKYDRATDINSFQKDRIEMKTRGATEQDIEEAALLRREAREQYESTLRIAAGREYLDFSSSLLDSKLKRNTSSNARSIVNEAQKIDEEYEKASGAYRKLSEKPNKSKEDEEALKEAEILREQAEKNRNEYLATLSQDAEEMMQDSVERISLLAQNGQQSDELKISKQVASFKKMQTQAAKDLEYLRDNDLLSDERYNELSEILSQHTVEDYENLLRTENKAQKQERKLQRDQHLDDIRFQTEMSDRQRQHEYEQYDRQRWGEDRSRLAQYYRQGEERRFQLQSSYLTNTQNAKKMREQIGLWKEEKKTASGERLDTLNAQLEEGEAKLKQYESAAASAEQEMQKFGSGTNAAASIVRTMSEAVGQLAQRLGRQLFSKALQETKRFVQDFDRSMTEIQMITLKSDQEISQLGTHLIDTALNTGTTVSDVTSAASNLYRQGLSDSEVDARLDDVLKFSKVSGIKPDEASKILTTAIQNDLVSNSEEAMDALVALGDTAATTASEIAKGMQKSAASAKQAGMSYGELVTLLTIGTSKTQLGGSSIGSALQTMIYRLYKVNSGEDFFDENGNHIAATAATEALGRMGVKIFDDQGQFRGPYQILQDIAANWEGADDITQSAILSTLGAGRQRSNVATLIQGLAADNGEIAGRYLNTAENSQGITDEKYQAYLDSLEAKINGVRTSWDGLVNTFNASGFATGVLDSVANFIQLLTSASGAVDGLAIKLPVLAAAITAVSVALGTAMASNPMLAPLLGAAVAVTGIATAIGAVSKVQKESSPAVIERQAISREESVIEARQKDIDRANELYEKAQKNGGDISALTENEQAELSSILTRLGNNFGQASQAAQDLAGSFGNVGKEIDTYQKNLNEYTVQATKRALSSLPVTSNIKDMMESPVGVITPEIVSDVNTFLNMRDSEYGGITYEEIGPTILSGIFRNNKQKDYGLVPIAQKLFSEGRTGVQVGDLDSYYSLLGENSDEGKTARAQFFKELTSIKEQGYDYLNEDYRSYLKDMVSMYAEKEVRPELEAKGIFKDDEITAIVSTFSKNIIDSITSTSDSEIPNIDLPTLVFNEIQRIIDLVLGTGDIAEGVDAYTNLKEDQAAQAKKILEDEEQRAKINDYLTNKYLSEMGDLEQVHEASFTDANGYKESYQGDAAVEKAERASQVDYNREHPIEQGQRFQTAEEILNDPTKKKQLQNLAEELFYAENGRGGETIENWVAGRKAYRNQDSAYEAAWLDYLDENLFESQSYYENDRNEAARRFLKEHPEVRISSDHMMSISETADWLESHGHNLNYPRKDYYELDGKSYTEDEWRQAEESLMQAYIASGDHGIFKDSSFVTSTGEIFNSENDYIDYMNQFIQNLLNDSKWVLENGNPDTVPTSTFNGETLLGTKGLDELETRRYNNWLAQKEKGIATRDYYLAPDGTELSTKEDVDNWKRQEAARRAALAMEDPATVIEASKAVTAQPDKLDFFDVVRQAQRNYMNANANAYSADKLYQTLTGGGINSFEDLINQFNEGKIPDLTNVLNAFPQLGDVVMSFAEETSNGKLKLKDGIDNTGDAFAQLVAALAGVTASFTDMANMDRQAVADAAANFLESPAYNSQYKDEFTSIVGSGITKKILSGSENNPLYDLETQYANQLIENYRYGRNGITDSERFAGAQQIFNDINSGKAQNYLNADQGMISAYTSGTEALQEYLSLAEQIGYAGDGWENYEDKLKSVGKSVKQMTDLQKKVNDQIEAGGIELNATGEYADEYATSLKNLAKGGKTATQELAKLKSKTLDLEDQVTAAQKSRGKSGKQLDSRTKGLMASFLGVDPKDINKYTKEEVAKIADSMEKSANQEFSETNFSAMLAGAFTDINKAIETQHITLDQVVDVVTTANETGDMSGFIQLLTDIQSEYASVAQSFSGHILSYLINVVQSIGKNSGKVDVDATVKKSQASLKGAGAKGSYNRSGGGGGGGKSAVDKLLEEQKHTTAEAEHNIKMNQLSQDRAGFANDYNTQLSLINDEINLQKELETVYANNIAALEKQRNTVKKGSDDWWKLTEAIQSAQEAMAGVINTEAELAKKRLDVVLEKHENEDKPLQHEANMQGIASERALTLEQFDIWRESRVAEVDTKRTMYNLNDLQLQEIEQQIADMEASGDTANKAYLAARDAKWALIEENAQIELDMIKELCDIQNEELNQMQTLLTRKNAPFEHRLNMYDTYAQIATTNEDYDLARKYQWSSIDENNSIIANNEAAIADARYKLEHGVFDDNFQTKEAYNEYIRRLEEENAQKRLANQQLGNDAAQSVLTEVSQNFEDLQRESTHLINVYSTLSEVFQDTEAWDDYRTMLEAANEQTAIQVEQNKELAKSLEPLIEQYKAEGKYAQAREAENMRNKALEDAVAGEREILSRTKQKEDSWINQIDTIVNRLKLLPETLESLFNIDTERALRNYDYEEARESREREIQASEESSALLVQETNALLATLPSITDPAIREKAIRQLASNATTMAKQQADREAKRQENQRSYITENDYNLKQNTAGAKYVNSVISPWLDVTKNGFGSQKQYQDLVKKQIEAQEEINQATIDARNKMLEDLKNIDRGTPQYDEAVAKIRDLEVAAEQGAVALINFTDALANSKLKDILEAYSEGTANDQLASSIIDPYARVYAETKQWDLYDQAINEKREYDNNTYLEAVDLRQRLEEEMKDPNMDPLTYNKYVDQLREAYRTENNLRLQVYQDDRAINAAPALRVQSEYNDERYIADQYLANASSTMNYAEKYGNVEQRQEAIRAYVEALERARAVDEKYRESIEQTLSTMKSSNPEYESLKKLYDQLGLSVSDTSLKIRESNAQIDTIKLDDIVEQYSRLFQMQEAKISMVSEAASTAGSGDKANDLLAQENKLREANNASIAEGIALLKEYLAAAVQAGSVQVGSGQFWNYVGTIISWSQKKHGNSVSIASNNNKVSSNNDDELKRRKELDDYIHEEVKRRIQVEKDMLKATVSLQDTIIDSIRERYRKEAELIEQNLNKQKEALNEEKSLLAKRLQMRKDAIDQQDRYEELERLKSQLASISTDSSRTKEAKALQDQIAALERENAMSIADSEYEAESDRIDDQINAIDEKIEFDREKLEKYLEDANNFKEEVNSVLSGSFEDMAAWLKENNTQYINTLDEGRKQMLQTWEDTWDEMKHILKTYWDEVELAKKDFPTFVEFMRGSDEYQTASEAGKKYLEDVTYYEKWYGPRQNQGAGVSVPSYSDFSEYEDMMSMEIDEDTAKWIADMLNLDISEVLNENGLFPEGYTLGDLAAFATKKAIGTEYNPGDYIDDNLDVIKKNLIDTAGSFIDDTKTINDALINADEQHKALALEQAKSFFADQTTEAEKQKTSLENIWNIIKDTDNEAAKSQVLAAMQGAEGLYNVVSAASSNVETDMAGALNTFTTEGISFYNGEVANYDAFREAVLGVTEELSEDQKKQLETELAEYGISIGEMGTNIKTTAADLAGGLATTEVNVQKAIGASLNDIVGAVGWYTSTALTSLGETETQIAGIAEHYGSLQAHWADVYGDLQAQYMLAVKGAALDSATGVNNASAKASEAAGAFSSAASNVSSSMRAIERAVKDYLDSDVSSSTSSHYEPTADPSTLKSGDTAASTVKDSTAAGAAVSGTSSTGSGSGSGSGAGSGSGSSGSGGGSGSGSGGSEKKMYNASVTVHTNKGDFSAAGKGETKDLARKYALNKISVPSGAISTGPDTVHYYMHGGLADYTGLAWVDGSKTRPESFLDAIDTENIRALTDALRYVNLSPKMFAVPDFSSFGSNTYGDINITINQAQLSSNADYDEVARNVGKAFTKQLSKQGYNVARYSF